MVTLALCLGVGNALAANATMDFNVDGVTTYSQLDSEGNIAYGGCMAVVSGAEAISSRLASCADGYITFSCSGIHNTKSEGLAKFSQAQLAYVSSTPIRVRLLDNKKHNGFCFADTVSNR